MKLHTALCLGMFATASVACDPATPMMAGDDLGEEMDEDMDEDEDGEGGLDVLEGGEDEDDGAGDDGGDDGSADDGGPDGGDGGGDVPQFDNDPNEVTKALAGMRFVCTAQDGVYYNVRFRPDGVLYAKDQEDYEFGGMYAAENGTITMSFPEAGFVESSVAMEIEADTLATFTTPSLFCHAIALQDVASDQTESVQCPSVKYIPETSWEDNQFHFANDGGVKRRRWRELVAANDTLYAEMFGIYVTVGDYVVMMFGDGPDGERLLIGQVTGDGLYIEQLEPERGACK